MDLGCKLILEKFNFLEKAGFKCIINNPAGFVSIDYKYNNKFYIGIGTDYREKTEYFAVVFPVPENEVVNYFYARPVYEFNIGTTEERKKLSELENTYENFKNVLDEYANFIEKNLNDIKKLAQ